MSDTTKGDVSPHVVAVGEVLWDLLPGGAQIGGTSANFVCHARELSARVALASAVGDDDLGREIVRRMQARGVDTAAVAVVPDKQTGIVEVSVDASGMPTYRIVEDVAWDHIPWSASVARLASTADVVCWGTLAQRSPGSRATVADFLNQVGPETLKVFDINLRVPDPDRAMVEASLQRADVVKLNDEELPRVAELCGIAERAVLGQLAELS
ncbi:MAG: PfkB family carbohydrate kinase, partial [Armatimonadaceae bacterium]